MNKGYFIVFDGPNGTGKTTISERIAKELKLENFEICLTKEPTLSKLGYLSKEYEELVTLPEVLACLVAADRYNHISEIINPALKDKKIVICDRYFPSSLVLQRIDGLDLEFILALNSRIVVPDITFILFSSLNVILSRLKTRIKLSRFERLGSEGIAQEIKYYKENVSLLQKIGYKTYLIDNERNINNVISKIKDLILNLINNSI